MHYILYCGYLGQCTELQTRRTFISITFSSTIMLIKRMHAAAIVWGNQD